MGRTLRFGILGCARICRRGLIPGIQGSRTGELMAIASRDEQHAAAWADEFGIPRHYGRYDALLDDPEIDAVYIPLPNELHRPWALSAAAAGKHILCEKPLGLHLADAEEIVTACRARGVLLMEAFMWRHHPRVAAARTWIADGRIGDLREVKMDFSFNIAPGDWRLDPHRGGGALFDLGCYAINAARLFTGREPTEVLARGRRGPTGVDMTTGLLLRFPGDVLLVADCSFDCTQRNRLEVVGTRGAIEFPGGVLPAVESELRLTTEEGDEVLSIASAHQYALQVDAFCQGVADGSLPAGAEDGLANMAVLDAALRSLQAEN